MSVAMSYAELQVERTAEQLGRYRELVNKAAGGWAIPQTETDELDKLLEELELPATCLRRDVDATRSMWAAETEHRKVELAWLYPHLFADRHQWAELRRADRAARRRILAELRNATAAEI